MTTYNTYQEAKIVNPDKEIIRFNKQGEFKVVRDDELSAYLTTWSKCNPADYCVTVEKFLADNKSLPIGASILHPDGSMNLISDDRMLQVCSGDLNSFVLMVEDQNKETPFLQTGEDFEHSKTLNFIRDRLVEVHGEPKNLDYMHKLNNAIAFVERMEDPSKLCGSGTGKEEKPRRTKVEWGCVHYSEVVHYFDIAGSDLYYFPSSNAGKCNSLQDYIDNLQDDGDPCLYHRIETEITEREEFIEELTSIQKAIGDCHLSDFYDALYDSGKFKLVN